jgi:hypothetical protein
MIGKRRPGRLCSIRGCRNLARANGLCQKHYMRVRRHGDANTTSKRGPKPFGVSSMFSKSSPRTQARYRRALNLGGAYKMSGPVFERALDEATRPNGSINVTGLLRAIEIWGRANERNAET